MDATNIMIRAEATPNPASMRFILDRPVLEDGSAEYTSTMQAESSPLAMRLFMLPMVTSVFLGPNFITVTAEDGNWATLRDQVVNAVRAHYESGQPVTLDASDGTPTETASAGEVEAGIIRVINEEIRPAVAMDGGDVIFVAYKDGIVHLRLRGACSGCPSATFTLKMGIERRLRDEFPEIQAVQSV